MSRENLLRSHLYTIGEVQQHRQKQIALSWSIVHVRDALQQTMQHVRQTAYGVASPLSSKASGHACGRRKRQLCAGEGGSGREQEKEAVAPVGKEVVTGCWFT
jgi:hypothetical protein